ncbi:MAG TPA: hypothetical protein VMN36_08075 [Verrucomicrobiales bacterium]|nr:hypothetical protein [Verrucomicrobiales bacterium]
MIHKVYLSLFIVIQVASLFLIALAGKGMDFWEARNSDIHSKFDSDLALHTWDSAIRDISSKVTKWGMGVGASILVLSSIGACIAGRHVSQQSKDIMHNHNANEIRQLVSDGRWKRRHLESLRKEFGEQALFDALFSAFTQEPQVPHREQEPPAKYLLQLRPQSEGDLPTLIRRTLRGWNLSIEELPFYFRDTSGIDRVRDALQTIESEEALDETEKKAIATYRFWLTLDSKAQQDGAAPSDGC